MLVRPSYEPDGTQEFVDDESGTAPAAHELDAVGYTRQPLENVRVVLDRRPPFLDADDVDFGDLEVGERISGAVIFMKAEIDRGARLIAFCEFERDARGRPPATTGGPVTLEWSDTGFLSFRSAQTAVTARAALDVHAVYTQRHAPRRHDGGGGR
jgi:hypothetical protein